MIHTWLIELFDHSWYFSLSVINIFTRRNPHLKSLAKEGKVLTAFSRLCTLGCLYSTNYVPCQWNLDSMLWSSAGFRFLELMYRLQSPWHKWTLGDVQYRAVPFKTLIVRGMRPWPFLIRLTFSPLRLIPFFLCLPLSDWPKFLAFSKKQ